MVTGSLRWLASCTINRSAYSVVWESMAELCQFWILKSRTDCGTVPRRVRREATRSVLGPRGDRGARGADRPRVSQPRAFRRGAGRLHLRHPLRDVRHRLPLCDVAAASADAALLAARLAALLPAPVRRHERPRARPAVL